MLWLVPQLRQFTSEARALAGVRRNTAQEDYFTAIANLRATEGKRSSNPDLFVVQGDLKIVWESDFAGGLELLGKAQELRPRDFLIRQNIGYIDLSEGFKYRLARRIRGTTRARG